MSTSLLSMLFPSPPASVPPLSPRVVSGNLPSNVSGRILGLYELSLTQHGGYQSVSGSSVLKAPKFYSAYTGPKRADLDVVGASALVDARRQIQFTGQVLGPVDLTEAAHYSFLVNRGGAPYPGHIQGQPRIAFDAIVQVSTGSASPTGTVTLLDAQGQAATSTTLPASKVQIKGTSIRVTVPLNSLPTTAARPAHARFYRYTFTASVPGNSERDFAGFAPENSMSIIDLPSALRRSAVS